MSVNTQALIRSAPKTSGTVDGQTGDGGQQSKKDAADQFQSMLSSVRDGGTGTAKGAPQAETAQSAAAQDDQGAAQNTPEQPAQQASGEGAAPKASFPVTNLADAIRTVSQAVMGNAAGAQGGAEAAGVGGGDPQASAERTQARLPGALPLGTVLAARLPQAPGQVAAAGNPSAAAQTAGQSIPAARFPVTPVDGDGTAKPGTSSLFAQFGIEPERVSDGGVGQAGNRTMLPEDAAGTVKILSQETHFAPNQRLSPAQQVGEQIATALKDVPTDINRLQGGLTAKAEGPVLKTLDIQLTPYELGTVKVSLRMVGDNVEVSLATSKAQTAELLKQDRQLLDQMLRTTGFKADTITIQAADDRGTATTTNLSNNSSTQGQQGTNSGTFGDNPNQGDSGTGAGNRGGRSGQNAETGASPGFETAMEDGHENGTGNGLSDGIYM